MPELPAACGVGLVVLSMGGEKLDTRKASGKLMLTILVGVATWESEIMLERQRYAVQIRRLRAELRPAAIAKKLHSGRAGQRLPGYKCREGHEAFGGMKQLSQRHLLGAPMQGGPPNGNTTRDADAGATGRNCGTRTTTDEDGQSSSGCCR